MGDKNKYIKFISSIMVSLFAVMIFMEFVGIRIHHDESTGLVEVVSTHTYSEKTENSSSKRPCQKDEMPIEHFIHNGVNVLSVDMPHVFYLDQVVLPEDNPYTFHLSPILKSEIIQERTPLPLYLSSTRPNRAPPTYLS